MCEESGGCLTSDCDGWEGSRRACNKVERSTGSGKVRKGKESWVRGCGKGGRQE